MLSPSEILYWQIAERILQLQKPYKIFDVLFFAFSVSFNVFQNSEQKQEAKNIVFIKETKDEDHGSSRAKDNLL